MFKQLFFGLAAYCMLMLAPVVSQAAGIAVLSHVDITPYRTAIAGFREQVALPVQEYHLGGKNEHRDAVAAAIRQQQPVLIFALGKTALNFARSMQFDVPVIFVFVLHPNKHQALRREFCIAMSIAPKQQFNMLLKLSPGMKRVGVVYDPKKSAALIRQAKVAAKLLGIHLITMSVSTQKAAAYAIADVMPQVDAMWMVPDTTVLTSTTFKQMTRLSLQHAVALIGLAPKYVRAGSLFALSFDSQSVGRQAGAMAKRILQGKKLAQCVMPDALHFVLNTQTADRLGVYVSPTLLKQAAHLYPKRNGESR